MESNIWKDCCKSHEDTKINKKNYENSLETGTIPKGLIIKQVLAFQPIKGNFFIKCKEILLNAEKNLVEVML